MVDERGISIIKEMLTDKAALRAELLELGETIDESNVDFAISLLEQMTTEDGQIEIMTKLSNNNPGATHPAFNLVNPCYLKELTFLLTNNITGIDLYCMWKDMSGKDMNNLIINVWALESGVYSKEEIETNFKVSRISNDAPANFDYSNMDYDLVENWKRWLNREHRHNVMPFVFDNVFKAEDYMKNLDKVRPTSQEFKDYVELSRKYQYLIRYLSRCYLSAKFVSMNKNEITITMMMPLEAKDYQNMPYLKHGKEETFTININQMKELLADSDSEKFFDEATVDDLEKSLSFLRHARNQFLPSLVVIRNLPIEEINNFYINGNDKRYGKLVADVNCTDYEEQEGLFKLAYILGLFNESANISNKAFEFIEQNMAGKVTGEHIHKIFGSLNLKQGYKKDFADFFMIHYSKNPNCFINEEDIDLSTNIYYDMENILKFRKEKQIKTNTNNKRLTPEDAMNALNDMAFDKLIIETNATEEEIPIIKYLSKYTHSPNEIRWGLNLLNKAKEITEDKFMLPYIEDTFNSNYKFRLIKKGDPEILVTGRKTNCCFAYNGASHSSLRHAIISENSTVLVIESPETYAQGWLWLDRKNKLLCIDNIEGNFKRDKNNFYTANEFLGYIIRFADKMLIELNKRGVPCEKVNLGLGHISYILSNSLTIYREHGLIEYDENAKLDYIREHNLYTDAQVQYTLSNNNLIKLHNEYLSKKYGTINAAQSEAPQQAQPE